MKNKFKILFNSKKTEHISQSECRCLNEDFHRSFIFVFAAGNNDAFKNVVRENLEEYEASGFGDRPRREITRSFSPVPGQIVKSDIIASVHSQLKDMVEIIKKENKLLLYLKMSKETQDRFRTNYSYEVSYPPRDLTDYDRSIGKILGCIWGMKIVQDNSLKLCEVQPIVRAIGSSKSKFQKIFSN
jgi:hypothetical protein